MAITRSDKTYSGTLATAGATVDTIAENTVFIMKGFWVSNANAAAKKAELLIDDKRLLPYVKAIGSGDTLIMPDLNIPIAAGKTIKVKGEVASDMDYYIWGINEVTS